MKVIDNTLYLYLWLCNIACDYDFAKVYALRYKSFMLVIFDQKNI
jgi:hypothetical protein